MVSLLVGLAASRIATATTRVIPPSFALPLSTGTLSRHPLYLNAIWRFVSDPRLSADLFRPFAYENY